MDVLCVWVVTVCVRDGRGCEKGDAVEDVCSTAESERKSERERGKGVCGVGLCSLVSRTVSFYTTTHPISSVSVCGLCGTVEARSAHACSSSQSLPSSKDSTPRESPPCPPSLSSRDSSTNAFPPVRLALLALSSVCLEGFIDLRLRRRAFLLDDEVFQPLVLELELRYFGLQGRVAVVELFVRLFEVRFSLLLFHAEASGGGRVAAPLVFFGCEAGLLFEGD